MIQIEMRGTVKRIFDETRGSYTNHYIVVSEPANTKAGENVIAFRDRNNTECAEGDEVEVEAFVDGRQWDGANGLRYFADFNLKRLKVVKAAAPKSIDGNTKDGAWQTWRQHDMGDAQGFAEFCQLTTGKRSSGDFTADDWGKVTMAIVKAATNVAPDNEDLPF